MLTDNPECPRCKTVMENRSKPVPYGSTIKEGVIAEDCYAGTGFRPAALQWHSFWYCPKCERIYQVVIE